jgi:hypothetical protein
MAQTNTWQVGPAPTGLEMRQGVNEQVAALQSSNSGSTPPTPTVAGMLWFDTSTTPGIMKKRNVANDGWDQETPLESPIFTGTPRGPTAVAGTSTTQFATTEFVQRWDYTSAETALPGGSTVTAFAHGLGAVPSRYDVIIRCKTAESGHSVGDEVPLPTYALIAGVEYNAQVSANATNIYISKPAGGTWLIVPRAGGASVVLTAANWRIVVRARA